MSQLIQSSNGFADIYKDNVKIPVKSILKKSSTKKDSLSKNKKKTSHVNYAFDQDDEPVVIKPKTATVINKRTGKSKSLTIANNNNNNNSDHAVQKTRVQVQVH